MPARKGYGTTVTVLAGAVAVLALLNWYLLASSMDTSPVVPAANHGDAPNWDSAGLVTVLDKRPVALFQETVDRPLFHPSRKPVQRDNDAAKEAPDEPPDMRLVGVMKTGDQQPRALIRFRSEQTGKWLTEGEEYHGWRVRKVEERSVIVEGSGRSHELALSGRRRASEEDASGTASNR